MSIALQLKKMRIERKKNMAQLARELNIPYTTYVSYEKGDREPNSETLIILSNYFGCTVDYLLGKSGKKDSAPLFADTVAPLPSDNIFMCPVFETVAAGFNKIAQAPPIEYFPTYISAPSEKDKYMWLLVRGDSMSPLIDDGSRVLVKMQNSVDNGQIAVVLIDGDEGSVKRVNYGKDWIELISVNPYYPPRRFEGADVERVRVVGLVKDVLKKLQ